MTFLWIKEMEGDESAEKTGVFAKLAMINVFLLVVLSVNFMASLHWEGLVNK
jgi:hypothetical protein